LYVLTFCSLKRFSLSTFSRGGERARQTLVHQPTLSIFSFLSLRSNFLSYLQGMKRFCCFPFNTTPESSICLDILSEQPLFLLSREFGHIGSSSWTSLSLFLIFYLVLDAATREMSELKPRREKFCPTGPDISSLSSTQT
jgi:hypothetical protein